MCNQTTEGKHKIHAFHFRCLYAKLLNVNYSAPSAKDIYGDCQNFGSEINTLQQLWNNLDNDGTSAGVTSASPPNTSTLCSTTTMTTSTPTMSSSLGATTSTTSPTTTSSVPHMGQRTEKSTHTWQTTSILVVLMLSITGNLMQGLNSFLQKRKLNMKQKQMSAECICLNPDTTAAEKSPKKSLSYSNESVH
ncbi:A-agglutinin anchorage subunit-like [Poecilia reticulata]|uniref:A-agglutinin anchorage subunit-like n=1 Tax=Poecilia reticulata TaxID=8081 RepID=UPI0007EA5954|nr:PREDICTED: A-agglutinin anchorage subunit-like [Poecilia reticulata]